LKERGFPERIYKRVIRRRHTMRIKTPAMRKTHGCLRGILKSLKDTTLAATWKAMERRTISFPHIPGLLLWDHKM